MKITFFSFVIGDVDDPDIYAAVPIHKWQQTDHGRWVMENAHDLTYHIRPDVNTMGNHVLIRGTITNEAKVTEYFLRWPRSSTQG